MNFVLLPLIILGVIQGIAEFLPISSSGHLVIAQHIGYINSALKKFADAAGTGVDELNLFIGVALHIATLAAVLVFLRKEIIEIITGLIGAARAREFNRECKIFFYILAASLPAGIIGLLFNDFFERAFSSPPLAMSLLIVNGSILIATKKIKIGETEMGNAGLSRALIIGFFQAAAILPGISRSGMTITAGLLLRLSPVEAAKFSFLMSIPVIAGAGLLEGIKAAKINYPPELIIPLLISMVITAAVGIAALKVLYFAVKKIRLDLFGYYTIAAGVIGLLLYFTA